MRREEAERLLERIRAMGYRIAAIRTSMRPGLYDDGWYYCREDGLFLLLEEGYAYIDRIGRALCPLCGRVLRRTPLRPRRARLYLRAE